MENLEKLALLALAIALLLYSRWYPRPPRNPIERVLAPDTFAVSFYGWPHAERFIMEIRRGRSGYDMIFGMYPPDV